MVFVFKLTHFIPQAATSTPFRHLIPAISYLEKFLAQDQDILSNKKIYLVIFN